MDRRQREGDAKHGEEPKEGDDEIKTSLETMAAPPGRGHLERHPTLLSSTAGRAKSGQ